MKRLIPILMIIPVCLLSISASYTELDCGEYEAKSVDKNCMDEKKKLIKKLLSCEDCDWEGIKLCGKVQFVTVIGSSIKDVVYGLNVILRYVSY